MEYIDNGDFSKGFLYWTTEGPVELGKEGERSYARLGEEGRLSQMWTMHDPVPDKFRFSLEAKNTGDVDTTMIHVHFSFIVGGVVENYWFDSLIGAEWEMPSVNLAFPARLESVSLNLYKTTSPELLITNVSFSDERLDVDDVGFERVTGDQR